MRNHLCRTVCDTQGGFCFLHRPSVCTTTTTCSSMGLDLGLSTLSTANSRSFGCCTIFFQDDTWHDGKSECPKLFQIRICAVSCVWFFSAKAVPLLWDRGGQPSSCAMGVGTRRWNRQSSHQRRNLLSFGGTHGIPLFFLVSIGNYDFVSFGIQAAKFVVVNNNVFMARRCSRILFATTHYCLAENMSPKKVHETLKWILSLGNPNAGFSVPMAVYTVSREAKTNTCNLVLQ